MKTRTSNLLIRSQMLYPIELRVLRYSALRDQIPQPQNGPLFTPDSGSCPVTFLSEVRPPPCKDGTRSPEPRSPGWPD